MCLIHGEFIYIPVIDGISGRRLGLHEIVAVPRQVTDACYHLTLGINGVDLTVCLGSVPAVLIVGVITAYIGCYRPALCSLRCL